MDTVRLNKFIAENTGMSRRTADVVIAENRVTINGAPADIGQRVGDQDAVRVDGKEISRQIKRTILFYKPKGYIVSRNGQGSRTIYDLLPDELAALKPVGRLDKDSSGLLLLTNDGDFAAELTHPSRQKVKRYEVELDKPLAPLHRQMISDIGIHLEDGPSSFELERMRDGDEQSWFVAMHEGRNRQIRRTFEAIGYKVIRLHRVQFGPFQLGPLASGKYIDLAES